VYGVRLLKVDDIVRTLESPAQMVYNCRMLETPIDVWNLETFDDVLLGELHEHECLIRDYMDTETRNFIERQASDHRSLFPTNPHFNEYQWLVEHIADYIGTRRIRAWHYTRLTDDEVQVVRTFGIYPSTLETIRNRLNLRVGAGDFSAEIADVLFAASPFQDPQRGGERANQFWLTSHPLEPDDGGAESLLGEWGGESVYHWLQDERLKNLVASIGKPRVLELVVPIDATPHGNRAAKAVLGAFGRRSVAYKPDREAFDLYCTHALGPQVVIRIHTEGEPDFAALARGYPVGFEPEHLKIRAEG
jgi:hypothetical protein